jgi:hypothetical protein
MSAMRTPALLLAALLAATPVAGGAEERDAGLTLLVRPRAGIAYHPQLVAVGPAAGVDIGLAVAAHGRLVLGLAVEHFRFTFARTLVPVGNTARADLEATLSTTPVLFEAQARAPLVGRLSVFAGAGAGPFFTRVETRSTGGTASLAAAGTNSVVLGGAALAGLGLSVGPGRFTVEGRYHVASGEVDGAAKDVSAGGLSAQAGYQLEL